MKDNHIAIPNVADIVVLIVRLLMVLNVCLSIWRFKAMLRCTRGTRLVFGVAILLSTSQMSLAQAPNAGSAQRATLPAGWQQMSPDDFAATVRVLYSQGLIDQLSPSDHDAVRARGSALFQQVDVSKGSVSYQTLEMLHWLTRFTLDNDTVNRTRAALLARQDNWAAPYRQVFRLPFGGGFNRASSISNSAIAWRCWRAISVETPSSKFLR